MKIKEVIKMLEDDGWYEARQRGSHKQFKHPEKKVVVTIAFHNCPMKLSGEPWEVS